jgi:hypothetical protein
MPRENATGGGCGAERRLQEGGKECSIRRLSKWKEWEETSWSRQGDRYWGRREREKRKRERELEWSEVKMICLRLFQHFAVSAGMDVYGYYRITITLYLLLLPFPLYGVHFRAFVLCNSIYSLLMFIFILFSLSNRLLLLLQCKVHESEWVDLRLNRRGHPKPRPV